MKPRRILALLGLVLVLGVTVLPVLSCRTPELGLVEGRLRDCPARPNCVSSEAPGRPGFVEPLAFEGDPDAAFRSLVAFLEEEPRVSVEEVGDAYVHAVFTTRLLRFRDDVELRLDREAGVVHVRSASRVGYSDLGANQARIESIRSRWNPQAASSATR
jgi:uncharacterized protein (DUF1499 family)